jgi:hypothetical protein
VACAPPPRRRDGLLGPVKQRVGLGGRENDPNDFRRRSGFCLSRGRRGRLFLPAGRRLLGPSPTRRTRLRLRDRALSRLLLRRPMRGRQAAMDTALSFPWKGARSTWPPRGFAMRVATVKLIGRGEGLPPCRARAAEEQFARLSLDHLSELATHNGFLTPRACIRGLQDRDSLLP